MDAFEKLAVKIIKEQEGIIGPVALEQANKVSGLTVDWQNQEVKIEGNGTDTLEKLVEQYQHLFGRTSVEVCKGAVRSMISEIPEDKIPTLLK